MYTPLNVNIGGTQWTSDNATSQSINMMQHMLGWLDRNRNGRFTGGATLVEITEVFHHKA